MNELKLDLDSRVTMLEIMTALLVELVLKESSVDIIEKVMNTEGLHPQSKAHLENLLEKVKGFKS